MSSPSVLSFAVGNMARKGHLGTYLLSILYSIEFDQSARNWKEVILLEGQKTKSGLTLLPTMCIWTCS